MEMETENIVEELFFAWVQEVAKGEASESLLLSESC